MTFCERFKKCTKKLNELFKKSIGPLVVFLFIYYLATRFILFPLGRMIWSKALAALPDGYIGLNNMGDLLSHPLVLIVGVLLALTYCAITFLQIECAFTFVEYRYNDKIIGFKDLVLDVLKKTLKIFYPCNWAMLLLVVIAIPFVNVFSVTADIGSIVIPEYILTVVLQKTPLFVAYVVLMLLMLYLVLKGLYVELTFPNEKNFKQAFKHSARLTKGFKNKLEKLCGLVLARVVSLLLFSIVPSMLTSLIHVVSKAIFGNSATFKPTMEILENNVAYPAVLAFSAAMSCAVVISLIVIWFHTDSERANEELVSLEEYKTSEFVSKMTKEFTSKAFAILIGVCVIVYCIAIPVCVQVLKNNDELMLSLSSPMQIIAHKGYTAKAPENTIPAMEKAIESGNATIVEFDVQATKDGVPVVIHDANAGGLTGVDKNISDMNLSEVKKLDAAYSFAGKKYKGTEIPTLEEYLKACDHRITLLLEIKNYNKDPELESKVMELLKKYDYLDGSCMIHSGSVESLKKVKAINPDIQCGLIMTVALGTFFDLPYADFFSIESSFVSSKIASGIHSRFKAVFVWTVDDQSVVEEMYDAGADGIICDDPDLVKGYLDNYAGNQLSYSQKRTEKLMNKFIDAVNGMLTDEQRQQLSTEYGD